MKSSIGQKAFGLLFLLGAVALWQIRLTNNLAIYPLVVGSMTLATLGFYLVFGIRLKILVFGVLLGGISLLTLLGLLEIPTFVMKQDYRSFFRIPIDEPWKNPVNLNDPILLHLHRPNSHFKGIQPTGDIGFYMTVSQPIARPYDVQIDSEGFRNTSPDKNPEVVVLGDSFVEGTLVHEGNLLTGQLNQLSKKSVLNLGQIWYGPEQELEVLKRFALPKNPKFVVWVIFSGNDLTDSIRYQTVRENWDQKVQSFHSNYQRSFTKNLFTFIYVNFAKKQKKIQAFETDCGQYGKISYYYSDKTISPELEPAFAALTNTLKNAAELTQAAGAQFIVAYAPVKAKVMASFCPDPTLELANRSQGNFYSRLASQLRTIPSIHLLDLTPALQKATADQGLQYFTDDTHWNDAGHATVAKQLHNTILELEGQ